MAPSYLLVLLCVTKIVVWFLKKPSKRICDVTQKPNPRLSHGSPVTMETGVWVNNLLCYCVALWIRVLLAELIVLQLVKKLSTVLCNPKVHYLVHKSPPPLPILNQMNLVQFKNHFVLSFQLRLGHPSGFHANILYAFLFSPIRGTWPIFLCFITRIILWGLLLYIVALWLYIYIKLWNIISRG